MSKWIKYGILYNGVLFDSKKEWNTDTWYNMDNSGKH